MKNNLIDSFSHKNAVNPTLFAFMFFLTSTLALIVGSIYEYNFGIAFSILLSLLFTILSYRSMLISPYALVFKEDFLLVYTSIFLSKRTTKINYTEIINLTHSMNILNCYDRMNKKILLINGTYIPKIENIKLIIENFIKQENFESRNITNIVKNKKSLLKRSIIIISVISIGSIFQMLMINIGRDLHILDNINDTRELFYNSITKILISLSFFFILLVATLIYWKKIKKKEILIPVVLNTLCILSLLYLSIFRLH